MADNLLKRGSDDSKARILAMFPSNLSPLHPFKVPF
jgi:hypothetical protein